MNRAAFQLSGEAAIGAGPQTRLNVVVCKKTALALDIVGLELMHIEGGRLPPFTAGAHIDLFLPGGVVRQYSLHGDPGELDRYRIAVLCERSGRGGSLFVHERLNPGDRIEISYPRNAFPLDEEASNSVLMAGGIGITPIMAMAQRLHRLGRPFELHYCARSKQRMAFRDALAGMPFHENIHMHFDDGEPMQRLDISRSLRAASAASHLYVCGPRGFMDAVIHEAQDIFPSHAIHREYFGNVPTPLDGSAAFSIQLTSTGQIFQVPAGKSVVAVLGENGIEVPVSCEQGICGTCLTRIVSGIPDHKDSYLTEAERAANDIFTPCCSRALCQLLVLDI